MSSDEHLGFVAYISTYLGLLVLTGVTFGLSYVALGAWGMPVALLIAGTKALLVALFFMHLMEAGTTSRIIAAVAISFVVLLASLTILDAEIRSGDDATTVPVAGTGPELERR